MAVTGRTGADVISRWAHKQLATLNRYAAKFDNVISLAVVAGAITSDEAVLIRAYIAAMQAAGTALTKLADYSGF